MEVYITSSFYSTPIPVVEKQAPHYNAASTVLNRWYCAERFESLIMNPPSIILIVAKVLSLSLLST